MEDQILNTILKDTYTQTQLNRRLRLLKESLNNQFFGVKNNLFIELEDQNWLDSLDKTIFSQFSQENFNAQFQKLEELGKQIPVLSLYLSFDPPLEEIAKLSNYFRTNFSPNFLFEIKLDPNLVAGSALVWKGVYKDYSLRKYIDDQKERLISEFKQFIK
ncbi:hypothetical protein HY025_04155 [Candidatus Daviesbacteria bacterium]|nr:hypothetical protein [Candidatus Daviesbacteria bacterium]